MDIEKAARILYVLANEDETPFTKKENIRTIIDVMCRYYSHKCAMLYFMRFLSILSGRNIESVAILKKRLPALLIISIVTGRGYHTM